MKGIRSKSWIWFSPPQPALPPVWWGQNKAGTWLSPSPSSSRGPGFGSSLSLLARVFLACHSGSKVHASYPILWGLWEHIQHLAVPWNHRSGCRKGISIHRPPALQGKKLFLIEITFSVMPGQRKFIIPIVQFSSESVFFKFCFVLKSNILMYYFT